MARAPPCAPIRVATREEGCLAFPPPHALPVIAFMLLALAALFAGWSGCSATGSKLNVGSTGDWRRLVNTGSGGGGGGGGIDGGAGHRRPATPARRCRAYRAEALQRHLRGRRRPDVRLQPRPSAPPARRTPTGRRRARAAPARSAPCSAGYSNCDGNAANGCETNTDARTPTICGACGAPCVLAQRHRRLRRRACAPSPSCDPGGWTDCGGTVVDGGTGARGGGAGMAVRWPAASTNLGSDPIELREPAAWSAPATSSARAGVCGLYVPQGHRPTAPCPRCRTTPAATTARHQQELQLLRRHLQPAQLHLAVHARARGSNICDLIMLQPGLRQLRHESPPTAARSTPTPTPTTAIAAATSAPRARTPRRSASTACAASTATPGYANCDNNPANGCEVDTDTATPTTAACAATKCSHEQRHRGLHRRRVHHHRRAPAATSTAT